MLEHADVGQRIAVHGHEIGVGDGREAADLAAPDLPAVARLDLLVTDFEAGDLAPSAAPVANVALTPRTGPALTRTITVSRLAAENRLVAIVLTYNAAARDALGQVAEWLEGRAAPMVR